MLGLMATDQTLSKVGMVCKHSPRRFGDSVQIYKANTQTNNYCTRQGGDLLQLEMYSEENRAEKQLNLK